MKDQQLTIEEKIYPNGEPYKLMSLGSNVIGAYRPVEGGFLPIGCRKPRPDEKWAQWKVAHMYLSRHLKAAVLAGKIMDEILKELNK